MEKCRLVSNKHLYLKYFLKIVLSNMKVFTWASFTVLTTDVKSKVSLSAVTEEPD